MEDVFKFLFVIAIIAVGFIRQAKKEAIKKAANNPAMPQPEVAVIPEKKKKHKSSKPTPFIPTHATGTLSNRINSSSDYNSPSPSIEADEKSEFEIHSVEEARRAIIWSEILQRKY